MVFISWHWWHYDITQRMGRAAPKIFLHLPNAARYTRLSNAEYDRRRPYKVGVLMDAI